MQEQRKIRQLGNVVLVGKKELTRYVLAIAEQMSRGDKTVVKARGKSMNTCIDAVEIARRRYCPDTVVADVKIGTDKIASLKGGKKTTNVSTIEIVIEKKKIVVKDDKRTKQPEPKAAAAKQPV